MASDPQILAPRDTTRHAAGVAGQADPRRWLTLLVLLVAAFMNRLSTSRSRRSSASGAAARLAPRFGRGVTIAGALLATAGMAGLIVIVRSDGAAVTGWDLVPALIGAGLGLGAVLAPLADIVLARVPAQSVGSASGCSTPGCGRELGRHRADRSDLLRAARLHARLVVSDPAVTPPACRLSAATSARSHPAKSGAPAGAAALPAGTGTLLAAVGGSAVRRDFAAALERTLWFQAGVFALSFLLMAVLPTGEDQRPQPPGPRRETESGDPEHKRIPI